MTSVDPRPRTGTGTADGPPVLRRGRSPREVAGAYLALTKPRIIELLLVTTVPPMFLAAGGVPPLDLVLATLVGGTLAAASANVLNCWLDRDIDRLMHRTSRRPLVTGAASPREALVLGLVLAVLATAWLATTVNVASAVLAMSANAFYVVVYTLLLKRRTPQNIVWGGAAGCMPVLVGWAAVTGSLSWAAMVLFAIIFFWTPPHYWPLSLRYADDYAAAHVPMLGAVAPTVVVARRVVTYSWVMVAVSLLLWPVAPTSWFYGVVALVLGGLFLAEAYRLLARARAEGPDAPPVSPMRLFHGSITYLTLLFVAVAVDPLLPF